MATCRDCGLQVYWTRLRKADGTMKWMLVDPGWRDAIVVEGRDEETGVLIVRPGRTVMPHFKTCKVKVRLR